MRQMQNPRNTPYLVFFFLLQLDFLLFGGAGAGMETGQQLRHSVNIDHGWTVGKSSPGRLSEEEPDSSQGVRQGGLVVASLNLTVTPVSTPPKMCSVEPLPLLVTP